MSKCDIDDIDGDWKLKDRNGRLEIWENLKSGYFGVYLYEHEKRDEWFILHAIRGGEEAAREVFDIVSDILI
jgi:hypothetical protein